MSLKCEVFSTPQVMQVLCVIYVTNRVDRALKNLWALMSKESTHTEGLAHGLTRVRLHTFKTRAVMTRLLAVLINQTRHREEAYYLRFNIYINYVTYTINHLIIWLLNLVKVALTSGSK